MTTDRQRVEFALAIAYRSGGVDGAHHKAWVIDQMVRALTGCPMVRNPVTSLSEKPGMRLGQGESDEYKAWVRSRCDGDDGPDTYEWDVGIAP